MRKFAIYIIFGLTFSIALAGTISAQVITLQNLSGNLLVLQVDSEPVSVAPKFVAIIIDNSQSLASDFDKIKEVVTDEIESLSETDRAILIPIVGTLSLAFELAAVEEMNAYIDSIATGGWSDLLTAIQLANAELDNIEGSFERSITIISDGKVESSQQWYYPPVKDEMSEKEFSAIQQAQAATIFPSGGIPSYPIKVADIPGIEIDPLMKQLIAHIVDLTYSITGIVRGFEEKAGVQDTTATPIQGIKIELFTDPNGDGNPADGESVDFQLAADDGRITFENLSSGAYVLKAPMQTMGYELLNQELIPVHTRDRKDTYIGYKFIKVSCGPGVVGLVLVVVIVLIGAVLYKKGLLPGSGRKPKKAKLKFKNILGDEKLVTLRKDTGRLKLYATSGLHIWNIGCDDCFITFDGETVWLQEGSEDQKELILNVPVEVLSEKVTLTELELLYS